MKKDEVNKRLIDYGRRSCRRFNEKFASIGEALKYVADSQAKSESIRKQDNIKHDKEIGEILELQKQSQHHLDHITKVLRFNIEEYEFQEK